MAPSSNRRPRLRRNSPKHRPSEESSHKQGHVHKNALKLFATLQSNDEIIEEIKPHWITFVPKLVQGGLLVLVGIIVLLFVHVVGAFGTFAGIVVIIFGLGRALIAYLHYHDEFTLVTSSRILYQEGLFRQATQEIPLNKVNDVSCKQGVLGRWFDYGELRVDSSVPNRNLELECIPFPLVHRAMISTLTVSNPSTAKAVQPSKVEPPRTTSLVDQIEKISRLYLDGLISLDDYENLKARLLKG